MAYQMNILQDLHWTMSIWSTFLKSRKLIKTSQEIRNGSVEKSKVGIVIGVLEVLGAHAEQRVIGRKVGGKS